MPTTIATSAAQSRLILVGAALLFILGMGIRQSFGLFLTPITQDLAVAAADFTLALAIQNVVWGVSQAFAARTGVALPVSIGASELTLVGALVTFGLLAAVMPAVMAWRRPPIEALSGQ